MRYREVYTIQVEGMSATKEYRVVANDLRDALDIAQSESPYKKIYMVKYEGTVLV